MTGHKTILTAATLTILILALLSGTDIDSKTSLTSYKSENIDLGNLENLKFKNVNRIPSKNFQMLVAESDSSRLEIRTIENRTVEEAKLYMKDKHRSIMFSPEILSSPYEGMPEKDTECSDEMKPSIVKRYMNSDEPFAYYRLRSDRWYNFETCKTEEAEYRTQLLLAYCSNVNRVYDIRFFQKERADMNVTEIVKCG